MACRGQGEHQIGDVGGDRLRVVPSTPMEGKQSRYRSELYTFRILHEPLKDQTRTN
jgi:hypothetical protein